MHPNMWQLHMSNGNINEAAENLTHEHQHYHQRLGLDNSSFPRSTSQNMDFAPTAATATAAALHNSSGHGGIISSGARRSIEKSHSLPVVNNHQYHHHQVGLGGQNPTSAMQNETFGNFTMPHHQINNHQSSGVGGRCNSNPFLDNSTPLGLGGMMTFATTSGPPSGVGIFAGTTSQLSSNSSYLSTSASTTRSAASSANSATIHHDEDLLHHHHGPSTSTNNLGGKKDDLAAFMDRALRGGGGGGGNSININAAAPSTPSAASSLFPRSQSNNIINTVAPSPTPQLHHQSSNNQTTTITPSIGPSKLYRLIASPPQDTPLDWDTILHRAISHPHEACFFDPNAGGHVFALHKLLRRTGDNNYCRPPLAVVDAVMEACPRAVTRKQAVVDEDELVDDERSDSINVVMGEQQLAPPPVMMQPPQHPLQDHPNNGNDQINDDDDDADSHRPQDEENDHDDVRFEYPLAIACEWEQDGEIVRLLASALQKTNPVYRSEVFRSLDYASLPNHYVRILLEENPTCVMERGTSSEENEGDDDDSPLEKVLFWWDDPDMMGMEDDIASYPDCNMRDDLNDLFEKLRMMLYAAARGSMDGYDDNKMQFQVLHHVLRIVSKGGIGDVHFPNDFAHAVLLIAKFIQREQATMFQERDETGSLPLHIACSGQGLVRPSDGMSEESSHSTDATNNNDDHDDADEEGGGAVAREDDDVQNDVDAPDDQLEEEDEEDDEGDDEGEHDEAGERSSGPSGMEVIALLLENNPNSIRLRDSLTGSLPLHLALQCNPQVVEMVENFIDLFPLSISMPDGSGRLPLHIALLQKSPSWEKILALYPAALESRDPMTGLLPFQLAAMSTNSNGIARDDLEGGDDSLSLCFQLLRKNPCLATGLGKKEETQPRSLIEQQIMARYKPRVVKLEEENERLQQRVKELESQLRSMMTGASEHSSFKKRKSSANFGC